MQSGTRAPRGRHSPTHRRLVVRKVARNDDRRRVSLQQDAAADGGGGVATEGGRREGVVNREVEIEDVRGDVEGVEPGRLVQRVEGVDRRHVQARAVGSGVAVEAHTGNRQLQGVMNRRATAGGRGAVIGEGAVGDGEPLNRGGEEAAAAACARRRGEGFT